MQTMTHRIASIVWGYLGTLPPISIVIYELKRLWNYNNCKINAKSIHRKQNENLYGSRHNGLRCNNVERKANETFRHCKKNNKLMQREVDIYTHHYWQAWNSSKEPNNEFRTTGKMRKNRDQIIHTTALLKEKRNKSDQILKTFSHNP